MMALAGLAYLFGSITFKGPSVAIEDDTETTFYKKNARKPASVVPSKKAGNIQPRTAPIPQNYEAPRVYSDLPDEPVVEERVGSGGQAATYYGGGYASAPSYGSRGSRSSASTNSSKSTKGKSSSDSSDSSSSTNSVPAGYSLLGNFSAPNTITDTTSNTDTDSDGDSSGDSTTESTPLTCTSNPGGGSYSNPVAVELSCSKTADIKYAITSGTSCDDPKTVGITYSSSLTIGAVEGTYCLSFYGVSSGESSAVVQQTFTIDNTLPHLQVSHPVIQYQTTELAGVDHITSNDFGLTNHELGQINLTTNDPGPSGLNKDCGEVVTNYVTFPAPSNVVLTASDVSALTPSSQVNVPLRLVDLSYGDNFIFTYLANYNYAAPLYSCATTKVVLFDFEYFQAEVAHGVPGTDFIREFEGGLSPYGFFEADSTQVYRGPAGSSTEDNGGQRLESGLFSIFY